MNKLVSVIIVNYNGSDYIEECLNSVYEQTYSPIEIIVVDNSSSDDSIELLKQHESHIKLIQSNVNLGFAKGNNIAIDESKGYYVALLNNDAVAEPEWVERLVDEMNGNDELGSCGCKIISYFDRDIMDSAGLLLSAYGMSRGNGRNCSVNLYNENKLMLLPSGCAVIYRKKALDEVGLFDEDFFCYCEDADLGLRLQLYGWKSLFVASSIVYHRYSESAGKYSAFKAYYVERNHFWFLIKNYPIKYIISNPFYTFRRYLYQVQSLLKSEGATSEYAKSVSFLTIFKSLFRAHLHTWTSIPKLLNKRFKIQREKKISKRDFEGWLRQYKLTMEEMFKE